MKPDNPELPDLPIGYFWAIETTKHNSAIVGICKETFWGLNSKVVYYDEIPNTTDNTVDMDTVLQRATVLYENYKHNGYK